MSVAQLIPLLIKGSLFIAVFAVGLTATLRDATRLFRQPGQLLRMVLAMNVVMLGAAIAAALSLRPHPAITLAWVALAVSPVMPLFAGKASKAGVGTEYSTGVLAAASVLAIVLVPLSIELCERVFAVPAIMPAAKVIRLVGTTVLAPLAAGMLVRRLVPAASRFARVASMVAMLTLLVAVLPVLAAIWPGVVAVFRAGGALPLAAFVVVGLVAGHLIGGPAHEQRAVLAVATACRHPGLAVAIAHENVPDPKLAVPIMVLYALVLGLVIAPYSKWSARRISAAAPRVEPSAGR